MQNLTKIEEQAERMKIIADASGLDPYERAVLTVIWRRTTAWNKQWDVISYSQFCAAAGMSDKPLRRVLASLARGGYVLVRRVAAEGKPRGLRAYSIDYERLQVERNTLTSSRTHGTTQTHTLYDSDLEGESQVGTTSIFCLEGKDDQPTPAHTSCPLDEITPSSAHSRPGRESNIHHDPTNPSTPSRPIGQSPIRPTRESYAVLSRRDLSTLTTCGEHFLDHRGLQIDHHDLADILWTIDDLRQRANAPNLSIRDLLWGLSCMRQSSRPPANVGGYVRRVLTRVLGPGRRRKDNPSQPLPAAHEDSAILTALFGPHLDGVGQYMSTYPTDPISAIIRSVALSRLSA